MTKQAERGWFLALALAVLTCPRPVPAQAELGPDRCVIGIDVGHSLDKPGATSARGMTEWTFNRRLAGEVAQAITETGAASAVLINGEGRSMALADRPRLAKEGGAGLFLSIHHDSAQPQFLKPWRHDGKEGLTADDISGYSIFVSSTGSHPVQSLRMAKGLAGELRAAGYAPTLHHAVPIKGESRELIDREGGIYRFDELAVLRTAEIPALLFEAGVIVNRWEEARLESAPYRGGLINAVTQAVLDYCALTDP
ncbi:MAG: N-acetylmuramoyl-L-alanine amidase [Rhodospirillum sp.]|nr:N-acetylmuramoyl-L-alanine amidase [Rhodospirillum sp.]MCF8490621.1 N-acetylmuramoyl-L-alanine amidase [Rhodospirillum sp.]MCF8498932.1 N-acetylmuramoyl-L-alanine amidase [Rhodospirillum sp.]